MQYSNKIKALTSKGADFDADPANRGTHIGKSWKFRFVNYAAHTKLYGSLLKDLFKHFLIFFIHVTTKTDKDNFFNGLVVLKEEFSFS